MEVGSQHIDCLNTEMITAKMLASPYLHVMMYPVYNILDSIIYRQLKKDCLSYNMVCIFHCLISDTSIGDEDGMR